MKCPVCRHYAPADVLLASGAIRLLECRICGTTWSVVHGAMEVVRDVQERSFLEAVTECVEGDDYHLVA